MNAAVADVYDYDTNDCLEGFPSEALVEASRAADPTGAVAAFFDVRQDAAVRRGVAALRSKGEHMTTVKAQADVYRIPVGTRLTVRWSFNGKVAARTYLRKQGTSAVFATPEGRDTFLNLKGATVTATERGFNVSWPGDPGATACEYTFTEENT